MAAITRLGWITPWRNTCLHMLLLYNFCCQELYTFIKIRGRCKKKSRFYGLVSLSVLFSKNHWMFSTEPFLNIELIHFFCITPILLLCIISPPLYSPPSNTIWFLIKKPIRLIIQFYTLPKYKEFEMYWNVRTQVHNDITTDY